MTKLPPKPWAETKVYGGINRIYRIWEDMRARNTDGYVPTANGGGILANIEPHGGLRVVPGTTCSPFTGTVIGLAFDPTYPRNDLPPGPNSDPYKPMFNGGKDRLPWVDFYLQHNNRNQPIEAIVDYGLGKVVDKTQMRRGDCLGVKWNTGGGHAVFCWDVHLNDKGEVDAFQYLGANSSKWNEGVTIGHCCFAPWIKGNPKLYRDEHKDQNLPGIENARAPDPVFKDEDLVVQKGQWLVLPGVPEGSVDPDTFRVRPEKIAYPKPNTFTVADIKVGRLFYDDPVPEPYCMKKGGARAMKGSTADKTSTTHVVAPPPVVVPKAEVRKDPEAPKKIEPKKVTQDQAKPLPSQLEVENALQIFYTAGWIESDPGKPDAINDDQSKKAIKEYQDRLKLLVDGIVGKQTLGSVRKQLAPCLTQSVAQLLLLDLFRKKIVASDPGLPALKLDGAWRKAFEEFQGKYELTKTGVPDADTTAKLIEVHDSDVAPTVSRPGPAPAVKHLYWVGNTVEPGGSAKLRLHANDLKVDQQVAVTLLDADGKEYASTAKIKVSGKDGEAAVAIPKEFGAGARVFAKVTADLDDAGTLEAKTEAPLLVRSGAGAPVLERADWRPYIGKDSLPDEIVEIVKRNRAKYPAKVLTPASGGPNNAYAGPHKWDYKPPGSHQKWATSYFEKKREQATGHEKSALTAYLGMLQHEGYPASLQTYDGLIVTWGVGLGGSGNGVHIFENLSKDAAMKQRLDDLGMNYFDLDYHVVDVREKKVVSSSPAPPRRKGEGWRHVVPLKACREQPELLYALIGISEDPATREAVAEAMYRIYITSSAMWKNQDKVFTEALYFMVTHLRAWVPAAGNAIDVGAIFAKHAGGTPSVETDKKIAQPILQVFCRGLKQVYNDTRKQPAVWKEMRGRAKEHVWRDLRREGKKEGFDPGDFEYEPGY